MIGFVLGILLAQQSSPDVVYGRPHLRGADIANSVQAECPDGRVAVTWWAGRPTLWISRAGEVSEIGVEEPFVAEVFGPRVQPVSFWIRCESEGIVTLGFRFVRQGASAPEFASGVAEIDRNGAILSYTGLEVEPASRFNTWLDRPE